METIKRLDIIYVMSGKFIKQYLKASSGGLLNVCGMEASQQNINVKDKQAEIYLKNRHKPTEILQITL